MASIYYILRSSLANSQLGLEAFGATSVWHCLDRSIRFHCKTLIVAGSWTYRVAGGWHRCLTGLSLLPDSYGCRLDYYRMYATNIGKRTVKDWAEMPVKKRSNEGLRGVSRFNSINEKLSISMGGTCNHADISIQAVKMHEYLLHTEV